MLFLRIKYADNPAKSYRESATDRHLIVFERLFRSATARMKALRQSGSTLNIASARAFSPPESTLSQRGSSGWRQTFMPDPARRDRFQRERRNGRAGTRAPPWN
ncbi:protein of unknown function [Methylorubrum extorquens]|uniref:Uncharacterized protein n=1 Tax=Methylorubrum extorquens TaxID=408 RepID=A0A2N9AJG7_METEX|nr:protein of unknown function [Methylorubrum extorquens]